MSAPAPTPNVIDATDLVAGYVPEVNILNGCNLAVGPGEFVGIIGPNGAGKSTFLKAVFGLVPVRSGHRAAARRGHHRAWPPTSSSQQGRRLRAPDQQRVPDADRAREPARWVASSPRSASATATTS